MTDPGRVLHVLSQRPGRTGSGTTVDAVIRQAAIAGWEQHAVVATPSDDPEPRVGDLAPDRVHALTFGTADLPFDVPGMSDVMPYASTRFRDLSNDQLETYRDAWRRHLGSVLERVRPDVVHAHHVWIVSALLADLAPEVSCVVHVHSTGLRQMRGCPHLGEEVRAGCSRHARFLVLHEGQRQSVVDALGVSRDSVVVVGAGYREEIFHAEGRAPGSGGRILFVGKLSAAKGLPWLLDAFEQLAAGDGEMVLHVAGDGHGDAAEELRARMASMGPRVIVHGALPPSRLAERMRASDVCVLPSFQEGLPLVLVEAAACGCRLVATALEPIRDVLAPRLGRLVTSVALPAMAAPDRPTPEAEPGFVAGLAAALCESAARDGSPPAAASLRAFTWRAVFERIAPIWADARSERR